MAAQRANTSGQERDRGKPASGYDDLEGFAIAVVREDGKWHCSPLAAAALGSLRAAEDELRALRSSGAVFGLLDVDDEFFVMVRPAPSGTRMLLSDATAAVDYDIAADVLDALHIESPNIDPDELDEVDPWPEGDLGMLSDLGLPEPVLSVIVAETDLYPDEQIAMIAQRLGFSGELSAELDKLSR